MASIRLLVDAQTPHGKMLVEAVSALYEAKNKLARIQGMVDQAVRGVSDPPVATDFHDLAVELGCPDQTAMDLFYLLALTEQQFEGTHVGMTNVDFINEFIKRVDQG